MERKQPKMNQCGISDDERPACNAYPFPKCKYFQLPDNCPDNNSLCIHFYADECTNHMAIVEAKKEK